MGLERLLRQFDREGDGQINRVELEKALLDFHIDIPQEVGGKSRERGRGEGGGRREAPLALPLHFTTQIPVLLVVPVADERERGGRSQVLSAPRLHCCTTEIPVLLAAPVEDEGDRGGSREA